MDFNQALKKYRPTVLHYARRYSPRRPEADVDEFIQEGLLVMWRCTLDYDPTRASFGTYLRSSLRSRFWGLRTLVVERSKSLECYSETPMEGENRIHVLDPKLQRLFNLSSSRGRDLMLCLAGELKPEDLVKKYHISRQAIHNQRMRFLSKLQRALSA